MGELLNALEYEIIELEPKEMPEKQLNQYIDLMINLDREFDQSGSTHSREDWLKLINSSNASLDQTYWTVFLNGANEKAIGYARLTKFNPQSQSYEKNKEEAGINIKLLKNYQRKGIGSKLLALIVSKVLTDTNIKRLQAITATESGKLFCEKFNGELKHFSVSNRLIINEVDWDLMQEWLAKGLELSKETGTIIETYSIVPEEILEEFCSLYTLIISQAPRGELEGQIIITPQSYKEQLERFKKLDVEFLAKIA